jgi:hypothetical protein
LVERGLGGAAGFFAGVAAAASLADAAGLRRALLAGLSAGAVLADLAVELLRGARRAGGFGAAAGVGVSSLSAIICSPFTSEWEA